MVRIIIKGQISEKYILLWYIIIYLKIKIYKILVFRNIFENSEVEKYSRNKINK